MVVTCIIVIIGIFTYVLQLAILALLRIILYESLDIIQYHSFLLYVCEMLYTKSQFTDQVVHDVRCIVKVLNLYLPYKRDPAILNKSVINYLGPVSKLPMH